MTTETVQNNFINTRSNFGQQKSNHGFLGNFLKRGNTEPSNSKTTELLRSAYKMLEQAERDIADRDARIKSLEKIITIDELTGLTNRRGFYAHFAGELDRTNRSDKDGGILIMIDMDYFKNINDTFGHAAGDEALKTIAAFLGSSIRPMDIAARLGGDEFIILMPNTTIEKSMPRMKRLGEDLNALTFKWGDKRIKLHASLGLKEYTQGDTIDSIIEEADKGMYENKQKRRQN